MFTELTKGNIIYMYNVHDVYTIDCKPVWSSYVPVQSCGNQWLHSAGQQHTCWSINDDNVYVCVRENKHVIMHEYYNDVRMSESVYEKVWVQCSP